MQFSGVVDVFAVKTLLVVSGRCLTAMRGRGEKLHDFAVLLFSVCLRFRICYTNRVERFEIC